ncbi:MAG: putative reverse transcriptase, partial [Streblomastix strix]
DSYKERESRLRGVQLGLSTEDVLSKTSKEKFKQKRSAKSVSSHYSTGYRQQFKYGIHWKQKKPPNQRVIEFRGKVNWRTILIPEQASFELASFVQPVKTSRVPVRISHNSPNSSACLPNLEYSYQSQEQVQSLLDLIQSSSLERQVDLNHSAIEDGSQQYEDINLGQDHGSQSLINKMALIRQDYESPVQKGRRIVEVERSDALDRQKQIKENHIGTIQTPVGTEGTLQQATHVLLHEEPKMSPILPQPHLQDLPIGGRLTHYISEWQKIGADTLVSRGINAYWLHKECPEIMARNKCIPSQNRSKQSLEALEDLIQKELQEDIIEEVQLQDLSWVNPCFAIPKAEQGKWRKITDCSILNKFLRGTHFIMEDMMTLRQIIQNTDFMIKIDLEMAFHHIPVDPAFRPFLGFHHNNRFFRYKAMCFGVKHAPLVFNKTLKPELKVIREKLQIRCIAYCDDLLFLSQSKEELEEKKVQIINILEQFGRKLSEKKSVLEPQQTTEFLGWEICTQTDQIRMREDRRQKMLQQINRWIKIVQKQTLVKVKALASFIGKLNFLRMQIKRGGLHMRKLNKVKSWGALKKGWNSKLYINRSTLQEIYWWKKKIEENKPIRATIHQPQAILTTDASATSW